jgi:hypothetical protein
LGSAQITGHLMKGCGKDAYAAPETDNPDDGDHGEEILPSIFARSDGHGEYILERSQLCFVLMRQ